jgi:hypothetical protein
MQRPHVSGHGLIERASERVRVLVRHGFLDFDGARVGAA